MKSRTYTLGGSMPKVVDHDARRQELAEATWRLIRREGLEAVSVRKVAREAGVSPGSLRHYFTSQSELLAYALRMVGERIEQRIRSLEPGQTLEDHVQALIEQEIGRAPCRERGGREGRD